jgi:RNA polymerase sigma-70 factor (ECF subfamily)
MDQMFTNQSAAAALSAAACRLVFDSLRVRSYNEYVEERSSEQGQAMNEVTLEFQKIHDEFRPKIQRYLKRMVGAYEAEDLTQEVFARIYRSLSSFRGESKLSTWIYRIATNAALDRLRDPAFKRIVPNGPPDGAESAEIEVPDQDIWTGEETPSPEQRLFHKQRYECYCDYIKNLPPNYRTVVTLSELGELAANEIAGILGLSLDVVKIRLHRGRVRLLQELKSHCKAEDWL